MMLGMLGCSALSNLVLLIHLQPDSGNQLLWILPGLVVPLFFGAIYGSWVGLVTGGFGYLLGNYFSIAINWHTNARSLISFLTLASLSLPWYFYAAFFSIGFVGGLATLFTKGRYNSLRNVAIAEIMSTLGILIAFLMAFNNFWPHLYSYETVGLDFTHIALPNTMLVLFLLPIMLRIHNLISRDRGTGQ